MNQYIYNKTIITQNHSPIPFYCHLPTDLVRACKKNGIIGENLEIKGLLIE